ncbi:hypothetical protein DdX_16969 [Ditylenchus destructor]|uniref:Uncharacterized protein n=1 Tax=Ditylenchus destructor TaxID=166010 RepID=A0AAD4MPV3_9BILA|nr:hypothetical protein DdX_16969 [Ditylenchus destructor]
MPRSRSSCVRDSQSNAWRSKRVLPTACSMGCDCSCPKGTPEAMARRCKANSRSLRKNEEKKETPVEKSIPEKGKKKPVEVV